MYVEIGLKFLERKGKNVEIHIRTDGQTSHRRLYVA